MRLFEKEDSSNADDCISTITFTNEDVLLGYKPHNRPLFIALYVLNYNKPFTGIESHFVDAKYYIEDAKKGKEVFPSKSQSHQPPKLPLKGFVPSTQEEEGRHEALSINEKRFDPKEKGYAIQDSRVGLGFTSPKPVRIAKTRVNNNYVAEGFSSIDDHKREENLRESIFNRLGPHRKALHGIAIKQSLFDRKSVALSNYISNGAEEDVAQTYHITLIEDGEVEEEYAENAPIELEEGVKPTINLGNTKDPRPIYTSASLAQDEKETYVALLHEFKDVFAWSYKEMPALDPKDLNNTCPKYDFMLSIVELMIDATTGHEALSFMDQSFGYNQTRMALVNKELTALRTPKELHPGNFLDSSSVSILRMPKSRNIPELKSLQGKLAYLRRFISNLEGRCQPYSRPMKKDVPFKWGEASDKAFKSINSYLRKPPVLVAPVLGRPLILYVIAQERFVGILLA
ncbi:UNVERIFIED_CONTAM: hypothetical protein Sangu_2936700 [Sesamum angustifolium]|uniref:Reverse transcriptase/retrotransposon-derived protein RNase H-like domain-containing protein n=1 Tax=Sesamum angustifolium TaxID=2727405 RepID=A0AAW2IKP0_9LAMI